MVQRLRPVGAVLRAELLAHVAIVVGGRDRLHDWRVLELLRVVELVAVRTDGVEVADVLDVLPDRANDVAFHDLQIVSQPMPMRGLFALYKGYEAFLLKVMIVG